MQHSHKYNSNMGKSKKKQKTEKPSKRKNSKKNKDEDDYVVESSESESDGDVAKEVEEDQDEEENDEEKAPKVESESKKRGRNRSKKKNEAESPMKSEFDIADSMTLKTWNPVASGIVDIHANLNSFFVLDLPVELIRSQIHLNNFESKCFLSNVNPFHGCNSKKKELLTKEVFLQVLQSSCIELTLHIEDDMGMGKTLQAIALLLQTKSEMGQYVEKELNDMMHNPINNNNADSTASTPTTDDSKQYPKVPTTLVVCPVVALHQVLFQVE